MTSVWLLVGWFGQNFTPDPNALGSDGRKLLNEEKAISQIMEYLMKGYRMKGAVFAVGIILLVIAFVLFFLGYSVVSKNASYGVFGDLGQLFSSDYATSIRQGSWMELFGGILGIVGIGVCIYGAVSQPRMRMYTRPYTSPMQTPAVECASSEGVSYCWKCGTKFRDQTDKFCHACGAPKEEF